MPKAKELILDELMLKEVKEKLANINGTSDAVKEFAYRISEELFPGIVSTGFYMRARYAITNLGKKNAVGPPGSISAALLEHSIPYIAKATCPEDFFKDMMLYEPDQKYASGEWKGYVCVKDDGNALQNVGKRAYDIGTVRCMQETHYGTLADFNADHERCKKLRFGNDVLGQLETIAAKVSSDKFPISFVRAQDPRVQAVITACRSRPFISLEDLSDQ